MTSTPISGSALPCSDQQTRPLADARAWLATDDPLQMARRHLALAGVFLACAIAAALPLRVELLTPPLDLLSARTFGALLSLHGTLMFYFVALPLFPGVLGYALLPKALGVETLVFPRLMSACWCLLATGGAVVVVGFLAGGSEIGWAFDAEFSGRFGGVGAAPLAVGVLLAAAGLVVMSVNFIATIVQWKRTRPPREVMPTLAAALLAAAVGGMVAAPILASCALIVAADHAGWLALFDPASGGDPLLFKRLFRFFVSPAQNMVLVAALGTVAAVVAARGVHADEPRRNQVTNVTLALLTMAGFAAWGGTEASMSAGGVVAQDVYFLACAVAVTCAVSIVVRTVAGMRYGITRIDAAMVHAFGFLALAIPVLGCGLTLGVPATRTLLGSTAFATAQLHTVMTAALGMAFLAGLHEAWPALTGRRFSDRLACGAAVGIQVGTVLSFGPQFLLGMKGASFRANEYVPGFQVLQVLSTAGMTVLLAAVALAIANLVFAPRDTREGESIPA